LPCCIFITLPPNCLQRFAYSPSTSRKKALQLSVPLKIKFLAVVTFNATDLPAPLIPKNPVCGFGSSGGPANVLIYTGAFEYRFLPINTPLSCVKFGVLIGINVAMQP